MDIRQLLTRPLLLCLLLCMAGAPALAQGRVIVLGFDGADARTTARMMESGELPNLARLAREGTFAPLVSTQPAESAAGWAALNTGVGPQANGVPSFIARSLDQDQVRPVEGHIRIETQPLSEAPALPAFLALLTRYGRTPLAIGGLLSVALVLFVLFRFLFAMGPRAGGFWALALGAVSGAGLWRAHSYVQLEIPAVYHNRVRSEGFWDVAAKAGVPSIVFDAALSFDRPETPGARVLGGLGLPDATGAISGTWALYSDDALLGAPRPEGQAVGSTGSGRRYTLRTVGERWSGEVFGPVHAGFRQDLLDEWRAVAGQLESGADMGYQERGALNERLRSLEREARAYGTDIEGHTTGGVRNEARSSVPLEIERKDDKLRVRLGSEIQELEAGDWSDWYRPVFEFNPLVRAHTLTRVRVLSIANPLELYVNSIEIDPERPLPWQPVSQPVEFAAQAAAWIGVPFETLGWSCMTNQLKDRGMPVGTFLEDIEFTMDGRRRLTLAALERDDWRLLFSVYSSTDRVQHMMYRHLDPEHPGHDAAEAAQTVTFFGKQMTLADTIPEIYRQMDLRVGEVLERMKPGDQLFLCADHGFTSFRRQVSINNLLCEAGHLVLKPGVTLGDGDCRSGSSTGRAPAPIRWDSAWCF
ncbi:MAG: alkaline phosphatase family protein [Planctomycetota bacterium]